MVLDAPSKPKTLKDISVIFDNDTGSPQDFRRVVQSFRFEPAQSVVTTTGGTPDAIFIDRGPITWQLTVKFLQDSETLGSLTDYLWSHQGEEHEVLFYPYGGTGWRARIVTVAPPIGGDMNTWTADTLTFAVRGRPSRAVDEPSTPIQQ